MTKKQEVDLDTYQKSPRLLAKAMEQALVPGGGLHPLLTAVTQDNRLRLEIRERRFNVYYAGGNLLLVDGRKSPWAMRFDEKYFRDGSFRPPTLPPQYSTLADSRAWIEEFPALIAGMDDWWKRNPKGERKHCQAMAAANSAGASQPSTNYLVLDLEYQWAQRRFDLVAARRRPTGDDPAGWVEPDLVFVEVKSEYGACKGTSGLRDHARDYRDIITARGGRCVADIKCEFQNVIAQKKRLGLLASALPFERFSAAVPELLFVLVDLNPGADSIQAPLKAVGEISDALGDAARIRFMPLHSPDYKMAGDVAVLSGQPGGMR
jgi:hypothetical protein